MAAPQNRLRLGIIGLGQAGAMIIDELRASPDIPWVIAAGADPRPQARERFAAEFGGGAYADADELCAKAAVDAVYIASPSWLHLDHALVAAKHKKNIICEKPLTLSLADTLAMVEAADRAGVVLLAGHTHSFDAPIVAITELVKSGRVGALRAVNAWNFNEFNHRPRLIAELKATRGPVLNQGPHQVDIVRQIGGGLVKSVRATTIPDGVTGCEGGYVCYLEFANGVPATLVYDGRSLFDTAELFEWVGEGGNLRDPKSNEKNRRAFSALMALPESERDVQLEAGKESGRYGGATAGQLFNAHAGRARPHQPFFGLVVVSCEDAAIRQSADGLYLYDKNGRQEVAVPRKEGGRLAELMEMHEALSGGRKPFHDGRWGLATLEVCFAILESAKTGREIAMTRQVAI
ncbi:MAG TPA: Gfo/Idh/MocA family oxidoreductase [Stellaceae bacterium]|jgi:predicted dehydrogenase|nr:Gfo/Idh/MocA family oxidoreductase [Stellaceae bacterium]